MAPGRTRPFGPEVPPLDPEREELVAGRRPVEEAFVARRVARRLYVVPQRRNALEKLVLHATSLRIPVIEVEGGSLTALAGFDGHQGIALVVEPRHWSSPDEILADARTAGEPPLLVVLDSLEDPQNVGTLLRTAEAAGAHGAIFPTRRQAPLTPAAVKASAGAVEHLRLAPVDDLATTLADLHAHGIRIVGADGDAPLAARAADLRGPLAIVVGSEGKGLSAAVRRRCDQLVRIPMRGLVGSLNASVAGSILLYEAAAQRDPSGTAAPRRPASRAHRPERDAADAQEPTAQDGPADDAPDTPPDTPPVTDPVSPADPAPSDAPEEDLLPGGPPIEPDEGNDTPDAPLSDAPDDPDRV
ncbi:MAG TPA: 23S rRNA (guanosine(2251)-2'-O)-methyltransferase RlmB [Candidatus Limnocylindrales bacterium]|nr:23S rRNA (guanosine(2251)-2'-O)-methyltransferase RlmB [Candidatus Limnocylindrales bacterium]